MPPKSRRRPAAPAAKAVTATGSSEDTAAPNPSPSQAPEKEQAHLLAHHHLEQPPHTYLALFFPLFTHILDRQTPPRHARTPRDELGSREAGFDAGGGGGGRGLPEASFPHAHGGGTVSGQEPAAVVTGQRKRPIAAATQNGTQEEQNGTACVPKPNISAKEFIPFVFPKTVVANLGALGIHEARGGDGGGKSLVQQEQQHESRKRARHDDDDDDVNGDDTDRVLRCIVDELCSVQVMRRYLTPYATDSDYLRYLDVGYTLRQWRTSVNSVSFSQPFLTVLQHCGIDIFAHLIPCVNAVDEIYAVHHDYRLAAMPTAPRVLRVGERLHLAGKETAALAFLLMCHSGSQLATSLTLSTLSRFTGLTPQECLDFVCPHRPHMSQGLVTSDAQSRNNFAESCYSMPQEAVAALTGNELTEEQLIKLERTALVDVLTEEKTNAQEQQKAAAIAGHRPHDEPRAHSAPPEEDANTSRDGSVCTRSETAETDRSENELLLDEDGLVTGVASVLDRLGVDVADLPGNHTVESIQAMVQHRLGSGSGSKVEKDGGEAGHKGPGAAQDKSLPPEKTTSPATDRADAVGGDATTAAEPSLPSTAAPESLVHKPYTTDFEYMEEAFKTLASLIRLRTTEGDMKDEDDAFMPRTKMEATMRELKGKVRVSRAVHANRVAATLAVAAKVEKEEAEQQQQQREAKEERGTSSPGGQRAPTATATVAEGEPQPWHGSPLPDAVDRESRVFVPRIEQLSRRLHLSELEKSIMLLMVGSVVSHDIVVAVNGRYVMRDGQQRYLTVGYILFVLCDGLQERVAARKMFYQAAPLIANGILSLGLDALGGSRSCFNTDLMDYICDVDRKMVDYVMGSTTETAEMVPGSSLYFPTVPMDNVVLPPQTTKLVLSTVEHYGMFERCRKRCGFGDGLGSMASGLAILFHGPSGTGKTMLANAVAHELRKRLLLVNVSQFKAEKRAPEMMRFLFREAKLNDAIIFFDECEALFESRETNPLVTSVLTEFERNDGLIILATNMAQVMDDAMNRRISLMVEFKLPTHSMRERIWQHHMPQGIPLADDVSLEKLALNYELSGGLIRNAVLAALNHAIGRENSEAPTLRMEDLEEGAKLQLRGFFLAARRPGGASGGGGGGGGGSSSILGSLVGSESYVTPRRTLKELVMEPSAKRRVELIARMAKSRSTLFSQWGFSEESCQDQGNVYLFSGPSGTGKSLAAEGIAYECGATIRLCNVSELLLLQELNIAAVFEEGRQLGAVIVFDEAQDFFTHSERAAHLSQLIQYYAVRYPKPVLVIATTGGGAARGGGGGFLGGVSDSSLDTHATRFLFSEHIVFKLPDRALRKELWRGAFPEKAPLAADVDFHALAEKRVSAKLVRRVAFTVCCRAAATAMATTVTTASSDGGEGSSSSVTMKMIEEELTRCILAEDSRNPARAMFA